MTIKFVVSFALVLTVLLSSGCDSKNHPQSQMTATIPNLDSVGGKIFKEFCSACHGLPSPTVHKAKEWPNVIERMQNHRIKNAYLPLSNEEKKELINYLQENAAG